MNKIWLIVFLFISFAFSTQGFKPKVENIINKQAIDYDQEKWIDSVTAQLTLDQKIAQFFMLGVYPTQGDANKVFIEKMVSQHQIGGLIFFKGHPTQIANWSNSFQAKANIPLFISVDGEWGINMRVDSTVQYPKQMTLGAIQNDELIYEMGARIGLECKAIGININLAPVMDVNNNPNNPVINDRSFGEDKYNVALKGLAYAQGMQSVGVMAVGKHFPGHGDTDTDSHMDLPIIKHSAERLDSLELYPFKVAIHGDMMGMMVAHLNIPALDNTPNLASSLSPKIITHLLKDSLGFEGLVFSDALDMKGVTKFFEAGEADKLAFLAGVDVLVVSGDAPLGISMIKKAVTSWRNYRSLY
jgi:beta-N-acetylhexosaminidase